MEEIGSDINNQLDNDIEKYVSVLLTLDESVDIGSTVQLLTFLRSNRKLSNFGRTFCYGKCERPIAKLGSI